ncbi:RNA binding protein [Mycena venus]|uniref:RNA binding protein n=1 Tax=Mycena venus TaxID=2733690 RepID=A0A8H6XU88_9AGAR|nr:RNA binding protein [Mycena venus]
MPPKPASRTWGTRFDTLPSSPPPSPQTREVPLEGDAVSTATNNNASSVKKVEKMPHDASVFVGSLPTNIEQSELSRLLSEHLSEHAEVKSIKLVKDSKGGVCAFVQCESAAAASSLIHNLHSNAPKHFLGRVLRYEPARAFRTLLISYRTPVQYIPSGDRKGGQTVQLDPPLAMRIWRPRNTKYLSILYNTDAVDAENHANTVNPTGDPGLFFQPVVFDERSIRMLCAHFGPLESFALFKSSSEATNGNNLPAKNPRYPHPHDGPRLPGMDAGCWEVKWNHRDDSVSALMTLRRVPHLTVTWAHHPSPFGFEQQPSPQHGNFASNHHNNGTSYPFHVQNFTPPSQPRNESLAPSPSATQSHSSQGSAALGLALHGSASTDVSFSVSSTSTDDWKRITVPSLPAQCYDSSASFRGTRFSDASLKDSKVEWTDVDFPPLGDSKADRRAEQVWPTKTCKVNEGIERPPSSLSVVIGDTNGVATHHESDAASYEDEEQDLDIPDTPGLAMSPITPKTAGSQFPSTPTSTSGDLFQEKNVYFEETAKDLDPTTLFVGGLEMNWDEERVTAFFERFGGLKSVKVVRPVNGRSAFAFVEFDNTESPARAVFEEHNRVYDGRAIRVQLRDCNPPRGGNWRYNNGPRRGRFPHSHYAMQRRYPEATPSQSQERLPSDCHDEQEDQSRVTDEVISEMGSFSLADGKSVTDSVSGPEPPADFAVPACAEEEHHQQAASQPRDDQTQSCPASRRPTPKPALAPEALPQPQYREWYDPPVSATMTPPLPSPSSSAAVAGAPYPIPNGGYFPPPWAQPYPQPYGQPYGMPYYPGFPMQGPHPPSQPYSSPAGSEVSEPAPAPPQRPWPPMGMYGGYISYSAYPRPPNVDPSSPRGQAPLQPTGFIQNEQGTLIPVYQPEALDQYMASNQAAPGATPTTQPQNGAATWQQFPPPSHAFPNAIHPMMGIPPRAFPPQAQPSVNGGWVPGQFPPPPAVPPSHAVPPPNAPNHPGNFRGGYQDVGGQGMGPNGRRHPGGRRDQHPNAPNINRNNPGRAMPNNRPRGGMHHMGYPLHEGVPQMQPIPRAAQFNSTPADWSQWSAAR